MEARVSLELLVDDLVIRLKSPAIGNITAGLELALGIADFVRALRVDVIELGSQRFDRSLGVEES